MGLYNQNHLTYAHNVVSVPQVQLPASNGAESQPTPNNVNLDVQVISSHLRNVKLTPVQRERQLYLSMRYGEDISTQIVLSITSYGQNTWSNTHAKIVALDNMNDIQREYQARIASAVHVGDKITDKEFIRIISEIRYQLNLPVYLNNITKNCVKDLLSGYIAEPILSNEIDEKTNKPIVTGYRILVKLATN